MFSGSIILAVVGAVDHRQFPLEDSVAIDQRVMGELIAQPLSIDAAMGERDVAAAPAAPWAASKPGYGSGRNGSARNSASAK